MLERVQRAHFQYFLDNQDHSTGLILDRTRPGSPATVAGVGFALTAYAVASTRFWLSRREAVSYTLKVLDVLKRVPQGDSPSGVNGFHGFYYHFLDPATGERATSPKFWNSELSTIDTALLMIGVRFAATFYDGDSAEEKRIREIASFLYERVEWTWMLRDLSEMPNQNRGGTLKGRVLGHGWTPEHGLIQSVYLGYSEALLLYLLALGSAKYAVPAETWQKYLGFEKAQTLYGETFIAMPGTPLFCYQYPHCWFDFRGIRDDLGRRLGFDYFENSVRATRAQYRYAVVNPHGFVNYGTRNWGLTASDGPGGGKKKVGDREIDFSWYSERGAPLGLDDGTIAPTAALSALPFAPHIVLPTMRYWLKKRPELFSMQGFFDAFNDTYPDEAGKSVGWVDVETLAIDQGPVVLMLENYRTGLIWKVMKRDPAMRKALKSASFRGGWLGGWKAGGGKAAGKNGGGNKRGRKQICANSSVVRGARRRQKLRTGK